MLSLKINYVLLSLTIDFFLRKSIVLVGLSNGNNKLSIEFPEPILKIELVEGEDNSSSISTCYISF